MSELVRHEKNGIVYFTSPQLSSNRHVSHAYFGRYGGVSTGKFSSLNFRFGHGDSDENVVRNHIAAAEIIGARPENIIRTHQKHTDTIRVIKGRLEDDISKDMPLDAIVTDVPGLCLTAYFADCQVITIFDRKKHVAAIIHAGWRGVANSIVSKTVMKMREIWECDPFDMLVAIGPSICRRCFETDEDVPQMMMDTYDKYASDYIYKEENKWHVDLKNITFRALTAAGVPAINIDATTMCTACTQEPLLWWSQRRNGEERGLCAAMVMIKD